MSTQEIKEARKRWTREETLLFLQCYSARKDEFKHSRKKKFAYTNVLEDMVGEGFLDTTVTTRTLEAKMRTLLIAYKSAKDNNRQTGATYCPAPFMEEMDEIFGREPIISNSHTLNLGAAIQAPLSERCALAPLASPSLPNELSSEDSSNAVPLFLEASTSTSLLARPSSTSPINVRKRKSAKENYYEKKLELKKKFYEDIKNMIRDRLNSP